MNNTQKVVVAAASGAVVGALTGILFAPAKGKETRQQIADKATDIKDNLSEIAARGKKAITELTSTAKKEMEHTS